MGKIQNPTRLSEMCELFGIVNYVESGIGHGISMKHVLENCNTIENAYGIELDERLYSKYPDTFGDTVKFYNGYSHEQMPKLIKDLNKKPTLFWLDAHFPGGDFFDEGYGKESDNIKRLPMEEELRIISTNRDISKDVFFLDDLRIYVDRDFEQGSWSDRFRYGSNGYDFVENLIGETHILIEHLRDEGYILAFPVNTPEEDIRGILQ